MSRLTDVQLELLGAVVTGPAPLRKPKRAVAVLLRLGYIKPFHGAPPYDRSAFEITEPGKRAYEAEMEWAR